MNVNKKYMFKNIIEDIVLALVFVFGCGPILVAMKLNGQEYKFDYISMFMGIALGMIVMTIKNNIIFQRKLNKADKTK